MDIEYIFSEFKKADLYDLFIVIFSCAFADRSDYDADCIPILVRLIFSLKSYGYPLKKSTMTQPQISPLQKVHEMDQDYRRLNEIVSCQADVPDKARIK